VADTAGLLRALARTPDGGASFPEYEAALTFASRVILPGPVLAGVDYFLRDNRTAMRKLVAEVFDAGTRYEYELCSHRFTSDRRLQHPACPSCRSGAVSTDENAQCA